MYNFKAKFQTKNYNKTWLGKPVLMVPKFIILHHTATTWLQWTLNVLLGKVKSSNPVSAHFLVDLDGNAYKLSEPNYITRHCWTSSWWKLKDLNKYALWIEILSDWTKFTRAQFIETERLIQYLMYVYWIPKENVLRHRDIAPKRKWDIGDNFWLPYFPTYGDFQNDLVPTAV